MIISSALALQALLYSAQEPAVFWRASDIVQNCHPQAHGVSQAVCIGYVMAHVDSINRILAERGERLCFPTNGNARTAVEAVYSFAKAQTEMSKAPASLVVSLALSYNFKC